MFASELTYLSGNLQGGLEMNIANLQSEKEFWLQKEVLCIGWSAILHYVFLSFLSLILENYISTAGNFMIFQKLK